MMKRLAVTAFALSLLGGASALADPNNHNNGNGPHNGSGSGSGSGQTHTGSNGPSHTGAGSGAPNGAGNGQTGAGPNGARIGGFTGYPGGWRGAPNGQGSGNPNGQGHGAPNFQGNGNPNFQGRGNSNFQGGNPNSQGGNPHGGYHDERGGYDRGGWRGGPGEGNGGSRPRYNAEAYPHHFVPQERFHWRGEWRAPPGFYYRHWRYGDHLPWGWFDQSYWIDDFDDYDLPAPPYGYEWVRVGPDALLVDQSSGEVVETADGVFY